MVQYGFPRELFEDVSKAIKLIPIATYNHGSIGFSDEKVRYISNNTTIEFPYRVYFLDVADDKLNHLTCRQQMILHCIYSRSRDGFVRQKHLRSLLLMEYEDWTIPYIVKICDEYIVEILEMVYMILQQQDTERFKKFCRENNTLFCKSYARMTSYWSEFYRDKYFHFREYIGRKLFRECFGYSRALEQPV